MAVINYLPEGGGSGVAVINYLPEGEDQVWL